MKCLGRDHSVSYLGAALAVVLASGMIGCMGSLDLAASGDMVPSTDTDTDIDTEADKAPLEVQTDDEDCDTDNEVEFHLSVHDSNSMVGPANARFQINRGQRVTGVIREDEFLNYYSFNYAEPESGAVRISAQMRHASDEESYHLQIGARAANQDLQERRPFNLVLSIDNSELMSGTPIQRVKQCCVALAGSLRTGDVISLVTWSASQNVVLQSHVVAEPSDAEVIGQCNTLTASGSANLNSGILKAYELAQQNFAPTRINRVILFSAGGGEITAAETELIAAQADDDEGEAIYLMGVGVGNDESPNSYNGALMSEATDAGRGSYIFIDSAQEAARMFGPRFLSNVEIAAREVRVELTLPPTFDMYDLHEDVFPGASTDFEPQHLAPGDAMIFHRRLGSCDPTVLSPEQSVRATVFYEDPVSRAQRSDELTTTLGELLAADNSLLAKGNVVLAYAAALEQLAYLEGEDAQDLIATTRAELQAAAVALSDDPDLAEIDQLLATYSQLF